MSDHDRIPMTPEGFAKLQEELHHLKTVERHENIREIEAAREHGDLKENAEYHYAKERQGHIAGRIMHLESQLVRAEVIDPKTLSGDRVVFGATVTILDVDQDVEQTLQIVGPPESDPKQNKLSIFAPLSRAMIGKEVGDEFEIRTKQGERNYEITNVEFK
ncbi:MAG: transcription elongation factor GreA [Myxococcota bacterium]